MRWHKPTLKTIHSFWGQRAKNEPTPDARIEQVRAAMLQATPPDAPCSGLFRKVHRATSVQDLWYLRSDLMAAIASQHGEVVARSELTIITKLFDGLIAEARDHPGFNSAPKQRPRSDR